MFARRHFAFVLVAAFALTGCGVMEQNHFPQDFDKVPVKVKVAFSEKYPNDVIKTITQQKMFDGAVRYKLEIANSKNEIRTVAFADDGTEIENPM